MYERITDYIAKTYKLAKAINAVLAIAKNLRDLFF
jgi:hypothetical protein